MTKLLILILIAMGINSVKAMHTEESTEISGQKNQTFFNELPIDTVVQPANAQDLERTIDLKLGEAAVGLYDFETTFTEGSRQRKIVNELRERVYKLKAVIHGDGILLTRHESEDDKMYAARVTSNTASLHMFSDYLRSVGLTDVNELPIDTVVQPAKAQDLESTIDLKLGEAAVGLYNFETTFTEGSRQQKIVNELRERVYKLKAVIHGDGILLARHESEDDKMYAARVTSNTASLHMLTAAM